jgi:hypothetical protein
MMPLANDGPRLDGNLRTSSGSAQDATGRLLQIVLRGLLAALAVQAFYVLWLGLFQPLLDMHSFRQTQTALSAYWLWHGGPWLAYETPVLGYPWSIPFEFPLYQYLVALLRLVGIPIDVGGRLVSFAFYIGSLWPLALLFRALRLGRTAFLSLCLLFLSAPIYLFWGRTVMVESCALFFGLLWLALLACFLRTPRPWLLLGTIAVGAAAILAKATTFPAFLFLGALLILHHVRREGFSTPQRRPLLLAVTAFVVPVVIGYGWVVYSDAIKVQNPFGVLLTSTELSGWNWGSWSQRMSGRFWLDMVLLRAFPDILGYGFPIALMVTGAALASRRYALPMIAAMLAFLVPFALFTNLHLVHTYYQNANAIFLLAAVGFGIASVMEAGHRRIGAAILVLVVALQLAFFWRRDAPLLTADLSQDATYRIAMIARDKTPPQSALIVVGDDWSSLIPYYAERRSLALPNWAPEPLLRQVLQGPEAFLGRLPFGGIVYCTGGPKPPPEKVPLLQEFIAGRQVIGEAGECRLLAADRM